VVFLPVLLAQGLYADGAYYAALSRDLAENFQGFWNISAGKWTPRFHEHPPLFFWLQSTLFKIFGDHWWVERLFCAMVINLNGIIFVLLGLKVFKKNRVFLIAFSIVCWVLTKSTMWAFPQNMLDTLLCTFTLGASYCFF